MKSTSSIYNYIIKSIIIKNLIQNVWHTEDEMVTDQNGACSFRGFYGEYELEFYANGEKIKKTVSLSSKGDNEIKVVL